MSDMTAIEWTDATWNPTTGCTKVSPGCAHCYIERTPAFRIAGRRFVNGHIPLQLHGERLEQPLHWRRPRRVFVNSLSDLFHDDVPDAFIDRVFAVMALTPQHTFQVLTKRPERMREYMSDRRLFSVEHVIAVMQGLTATSTLRERWPLPNIWLGVSVENQHFADERIPLLLQTPAAVRFISAEPLLGSVNIEPYLWDEDDRHDALCGLDWVIVGGESGHHARPFELDWARSIVEQCRAASVPVFVKQLGANVYVDDDLSDFAKFREALPRAGYVAVLRDPKGGDPDEWPPDVCVREFPK